MLIPQAFTLLNKSFRAVAFRNPNLKFSGENVNYQRVYNLFLSPQSLKSIDKGQRCGHLIALAPSF